MVISILQVETAIVNRLKEKITDLPSEGFPEKPDKRRLNHSVGQIFVTYAGADFTDPFSSENIVQIKKNQYALHLSVRGLRSHQGAYIYLDKIARVLTGYQISGCQKMYPTRERFLGEEDGVWNFVIFFTVKHKTSEVLEEELELEEDLEEEDG